MTNTTVRFDRLKRSAALHPSVAAAAIGGLMAAALLPMMRSLDYWLFSAPPQASANAEEMLARPHPIDAPAAGAAAAHARVPTPN